MSSTTQTYLTPLLPPTRRVGHVLFSVGVGISSAVTASLYTSVQNHRSLLQIRRPAAFKDVLTDYVGSLPPLDVLQYSIVFFSSLTLVLVGITILILSPDLTSSNTSSSTNTETSTSSSSSSEESSDGDGDDDKKKKKRKKKELTAEEKELAKKGITNGRWKKLEQVWNDTEYKWEDVPPPKEDGEDDEDDEERKLLFVAKHRTNPKVDDKEGVTLIEIKSVPLARVLRKEIKEVEELWENEPNCEAKDLFLRREALKKALEDKKVKLDEMKAAEKTGEVMDGEVKREDDGEAEKGGEGSEANTDPEASKEVSKPDVESTTSLVKAETSASTFATVTDPVASLALDEDAFAHTKEPKTVEELEEQIDHLTEMVGFIEKDFASTQGMLDRLLPQELISSKLLWTIFIPGDYCVTTDLSTGDHVGFKLKRAAYNMTDAGLVFSITGDYIEWTGEKYSRVSLTRKVACFKGLRKIGTLSVFPMTDKLRHELAERGKKYCEYAGVHYVNYNGPIMKWVDQQLVKIRCDGRVMCDMKSYRRMNPSFDMWHEYDSDDDDEDDSGIDRGDVEVKTMTVVPEEDLCLCAATCWGFSLVAKEWGELIFENFSPITFDENAYDHLVLEPEYKMMISGLVKASCTPELHSKLLSDVIANKGGGLICVLHGPPGVGKTLTAEAVAEVLKRPLYSVGAGELGTDAHVLERSMRDTLEVARVWDSILLIDEADVFLEARSDHELQRNGLVSVFLRLLEYHSGVMFLTTNRARSFDQAFVSRFSLALKYPDLDQEQRSAIWRKFLKLVGVGIDESGKRKLTNGILPATNGERSTEEGEKNDEPAYESTITLNQLNKFSMKHINGRVIKQTIRTAQALALSAGEPLQASHIDTVLKIQQRFHEDFTTYDDSMYASKDERASKLSNGGLYQ